QLEARRALDAALRGEMPPGFKFDYDVPHRATACGTVGCALGLGAELGIFGAANTHIAAEALGISQRVALAVLYSGRTYGAARGEWSSVTPVMVADKLQEAYAR